jgi:hypothetical protein
MGNASDPYAYHLNLQVDLGQLGENLLCEEITAALTAAVAILAPELLEADILADVELEAFCGFIRDPTSIIGNLTNLVKIPPRIAMMDVAQLSK